MQWFMAGIGKKRGSTFSTIKKNLKYLKTQPTNQQKKQKTNQQNPKVAEPKDTKKPGQMFWL